MNGERNRLQNGIIEILYEQEILKRVDLRNYPSYAENISKKQGRNTSKNDYDSTIAIGERSTERNKKRYVKEYIFDEAEDNTPAFSMPDMRRSTDADLVTYDDNGNVIPLSQRFNDENDDIRYSKETLSDGTEYVKLDGNIFVDSEGNELPPREAYKKIVGLPIITKDGETITLVDRLPGGKDMYNEFIKRWATFDNGIDIRTLNEKINRNIIEALINSTLTNKDIPDVGGRHSKNGISTFDTRTVIVSDDSGAYNLEISIAKLNDGKKIGYAKKHISQNNVVWEKIKKEASMSKSQFSQPSNNSILQTAEKSQANSSDKRKSTEFIQSEIIRRATEANKTDNPQETIMNDTVEELR